MRRGRDLKLLGILLAALLGLALVACGAEGGNGGTTPGDDDDDQPVCDPSTGVGLCELPDLELSPPDAEKVFDLGQVEVGKTITYDFDIINTGQADLSVTSFDFTYAAPEGAEEGAVPAFTCTFGEGDAIVPCAGAAGLPFMVSEANSTSEAPERLPVRITFLRYDDDFVREARLTISSNGGNKGLRFTTGESAPRIQVSPEQVDFVDVKKGETDTKFVSVLNTGSDTLVIDKFMFDAPVTYKVKWAEIEYVADESTRAGVTLPEPLELAPGASLNLDISYAPDTPEPSDGRLQIHSNALGAEWTTVYLQALQSGPQIALNPRHLEFGPRLVKRESGLPLQISSRGDEALSITGIYFKPDVSSSDFTIRTQEIMANGQPVSAENPLTIAINDLVTLNVYYTPDVENEVDETTGAPVLDSGTLVIENNSFEPLIELPVDGYGVLQECPVAVVIVDEGEEVIPQTMLHLHGDQSFAMTGRVLKWEWSVTQPQGSASVFLPSPTFPNPTFETNVAGTYTFCLEVWDEQNTKSCEPACFDVVVVPDEAIHIELLWQTPGDPDETDTGNNAGSDVDLHFIHPSAPANPMAEDLDGDGAPDPYFDQPFDAYWFNPQPDWGAVGNAQDDNPGLDRDDTDGAGPENINLNVPEANKSYEVAVHYWNDHGYGAAFTTVRVYIYQELVFHQDNVRLINYDLWCVAFIDWPTGATRLCQGPGGGYKITPQYQPPGFFPGL